MWVAIVSAKVCLFHSKVSDNKCNGKAKWQKVGNFAPESKEYGNEMDLNTLGGNLAGNTTMADGTVYSTLLASRE